jgi:hypothetical protein
MTESPLETTELALRPCETTFLGVPKQEISRFFQIL